MPKVNDGIHGMTRYNTEITENIKKEMEHLKEKYPIFDFEIYLTSDLHDKRWNNGYHNNGDNNGGNK
jgi:hypothetical protein